MKSKIDPEIANEFVTALGTMISTPDPQAIPNPRPVMLTFAAADEEDGFEQASMDEGMDIICLVFEAGREREGPTHIAVYEERNGELNTWPKCSPWAFSRAGPCVLLADEGNIGFAYKGTSIIVVRGIPQTEKAERVQMGRALLRLMTNCLPADPHVQVLRG